LEKNKKFSFWKLLLKCLLSAAALYIVFNNIDRRQLSSVFLRANLVWLAMALLLYNASKVLSSLRLNYYFRDAGLRLSEKDNLLLYYVGMFYNLFLPGGIGGDGYKVYVLHSDTNTPFKSLLQAVLFDRLTGLVALAALSLVFGWLAFPEVPYHQLALSAVALSFPAWYCINYFLANKFIRSFWPTSLLSLGVQGIQVLCAWAILESLDISQYTSAYLTVFLVSSLVSVLPISIGGIGLRELVFIAAAGFCPIVKDEAVAFSFVFFFITALSSLPGGMLSFPSVKPAG
jgi:uncharacterized membrane protein YbhN (UPF0104 family)